MRHVISKDGLERVSISKLSRHIPSEAGADLERTAAE
jgi:hypothetical protein